MLQGLGWLAKGPIKDGYGCRNPSRCRSVSGRNLNKGIQRGFNMLFRHFGEFPLYLPDLALFPARSWTGATSGHRI